MVVTSAASTSVQACYLLIQGDLPSEQERNNFIYELTHHTMVPEPLIQFYKVRRRRMLSGMSVPWRGKGPARGAGGREGRVLSGGCSGAPYRPDLSLRSQGFDVAAQLRLSCAAP